MFAAILATVLKWLGSDVIGRVLTHLENKANSETERIKIKSVQEQHNMSVQADVIKTGMSFKVFWIPWLVATVPLSAWFGWGMLDTLFNGALPDVAIIPRGLEPWAQVAWNNLFYSGGGVAAASLISQAILRR